jgi:hypothetical protein
MVIDWDATGSMMQGWGSILTLPVLVWAAVQGRQTIKDYSIQKRSDKHIDAAERILTAAYNARLAIEGVRSPLIEGREIAEAQRRIDENGEDLSVVNPARLQRASTTQVFYTRLNSIAEEIAAVWDAVPIALAYYGEDVSEALRQIAQQRRVIQVAADGYLDDDGSDKEFAKSLRLTLYRGLGEKNDPVTSKIKLAVELLETRLLPVLRNDEGSK